MSRRLTLALFLVAAAAGCGAPEVAPRASAPTVVTTPAEAVRPDFSRTSPLAILENGQRLKVGDRSQAFEEVFPRPAKTTLMYDLPQGFRAGYSVRGWERTDGSGGAGALIFEARIAAVMYQIDRADETLVQETVRAYETAHGPGSVVEGPRVRYWFWASDPHLLMVCAFNNAGPTNALTVALGDAAVLQELGVSPRQAQTDRDTLRRLFAGTEGPTKIE